MTKTPRPARAWEHGEETYDRGADEPSGIGMSRGREMKDLGRPATWLELAGAHKRPQGGKVRIHPVVGPEGACYALTLDRRWLCGSDGSVTLFHGLGAVVRFLQVAQVADFEAGDPTDLAGRGPAGVQCLCVRRGRSLQACTNRGPGCPVQETKLQETKP